jgi:hypothetical protein
LPQEKRNKKFEVKVTSRTSILSTTAKMAFKFMVTVCETTTDGSIYNSLRPFLSLQQALDFVRSSTKKKGFEFDMNMGTVERLLSDQQAMKWRDDRERPITLWTTEEDNPPLEIRIKQILA